MSSSDWSVCESDDEWSQYNIPTGLEVKNEKFIPQRIAMLFKDIEQKKVLLLNCSCPRKGSITDTNNTTASLQSHVKERSQIVATAAAEEKQDSNMKDVVDTSKVYEAFEFDDDNDRGPASAKRKTPTSVKRVKKEKANLANVVSDIRRQQLLDEMEAAKDDESTIGTDTSKPK